MGIKAAAKARRSRIDCYHTDLSASPALDWSVIDTVLLDMDGTLLDLRFDNWFWQELVPRRYAEAGGMDYEEARAVLEPKFQAAAGTMQWYCVEHWTRELGLDILALKRAARSRVSFLPGAREFLLRLRSCGKRLVLVTDAHPESLAIKARHVGLTQHLDASYSTHAFAAPKADPLCWPRLRAREPFEPARTLIVDDSLAALTRAREFGIAWLRAVRCPDSRHPPQGTGDFLAIDRVDELI